MQLGQQYYIDKIIQPLQYRHNISQSINKICNFTIMNDILFIIKTFVSHLHKQLHFWKKDPLENKKAAAIDL